MQIIDDRELADALHDLLVEECLIEPRTAAAGICLQVADRGIESLSDKQRDVFDHVVRPHLECECERCHMPIPLSELSGARDNGGLCSWCWKLDDHS